MIISCGAEHYTEQILCSALNDSCSSRVFGHRSSCRQWWCLSYHLIKIEIIDLIRCIISKCCVPELEPDLAFRRHQAEKSCHPLQISFRILPPSHISGCIKIWEISLRKSSSCSYFVLLLNHSVDAPRSFFIGGAKLEDSSVTRANFFQKLYS